MFQEQTQDFITGYHPDCYLGVTEWKATDSILQLIFERDDDLQTDRAEPLAYLRTRQLVQRGEPCSNPLYHSRRHIFKEDLPFNRN